MKKVLLKIFKTLIVIFFIICGLLFYFQENLIFFPQELDENYQFNFDQSFSEINVKTDDGIFLNGLLFKTDSSKGLIFYLHGNAGSLKDWGRVAETYTSLNYDVFILDYRGFGKSEGSISSQKQIFKDVQFAYDEMLKSYQDEVIYYGSSVKLKEHFKNQDTLITLIGQRHNGMTYNPDYIDELQKILNRK